MATDKFLGEGSSSAQPVVMHDDIGDNSRQWEIKEVSATNFVNIDNMNSGILRATGANFGAGAYAVVSTTKVAPATDSDKVWTSHFNEINNSIGFQFLNFFLQRFNSFSKIRIPLVTSHCYNILTHL